MINKILILMALTMLNTALLLAQNNSYTISNFPKENINEHNQFFTLIDADEWQNVDSLVFEWEKVAYSKTINENSITKYKFGIENKKRKLSVQFPMYKKNENEILKVSSATIYYKKKIQDNTILSRPTYPSNSVLNTGKWYKIAITERGVHKIDANLLTQLGVNVSSVNIKNLRLYGNGGQVLSETPIDTEPTDLIENAIYCSTDGTSLGTNDYLLFYADGVRKWDYDASKGKFIHTNNYYSDTAYYFITFDKGLGKRITTEGLTGSIVDSVSDYNYYTVHDIDEYQPSTFGKVWLSSPIFSQNPTPKNITLPAPNTTNPVTIDYQLGSTMNSTTAFTLSANGSGIENSFFGATSQYNPINFRSGSKTYNTVEDSIKFTLSITPSGSGVVYLDYYRINTKSELDFTGTSQANFRNTTSLGMSSTNLLKYKIKGLNNTHKIWNITDLANITIVPITISGSTASIKGQGGKLNEYVVFSNNFKTPKPLGTVANQNLHALAASTNLIITNEKFMEVANKIKDFNLEKSGKNTTIVTVDKIYNEFSSGSQDVSAIRNFIRMLYLKDDNPATALASVLFLGNASYDYKNRIENNTNYVPVYHSLESGIMDNSFVTDDYYGFLDSAEIIENGSLLDLGIGRIPINSVEEGIIIVDKMYHYHSNKSFGSWKNMFSLLSDNGEGFGDDSEILFDKLKLSSPNYNFSKLYADAFPIVNTPSGNKFPALTSAINNQVFQGTFLMNYLGHGAANRLSAEELVNLDEIKKWTNKDKLLLLVTGTCDFGRFDNPKVESGGILAVTKSDGGAIASLTTTQIVYKPANLSLLSKYISVQFNKDVDGSRPPLGNSIMRAKNLYNDNVRSNVSYTLIGNPAMYLALPKYDVVTDSIMNAVSATNYAKTDTLSAAGIYKLNGSIRDNNNSVISSFNGTVEVAIYDKPTKVQIQNPVGQGLNEYYIQNNIVFKGQAVVTNGVFNIEFVAPKDINYDYGKGKISYYAFSETVDASGADTTTKIGGFASYSVVDNDAPIVKPFIDNEKFKDGGVTGPDPILFVQLSDENGINVTGSSIGHDLIAILDGDYSNPIILNNFYTSEPNNYKKGTVTFNLSGISEGEHEITVRAWDVFNNSGEGRVRFKVVPQNKGVISDLYAYPNPVVDGNVTFVLQHNLNNQKLRYTLQVFDNSGRKVKEIKDEIFSAGNSLEIPWNGTSDYGHGLMKGLYFYKISIESENGTKVDAVNKIVFLN